MNSFTGIFQCHFKPSMLFPCFEAPPPPLSNFEEPPSHVFNTCGKPCILWCRKEQSTDEEFHSGRVKGGGMERWGGMGSWVGWGWSISLGYNQQNWVTQGEGAPHCGKPFAIFDPNWTHILAPKRPKYGIPITVL